MTGMNLGGEPNVQLWTREGFTGATTVMVRPSYSPDYISAKGPHVPRRSVLDQMTAADEADPAALPTLVATSKAGMRMLISARREKMAFVVRNVEAEELHFIQDGEVEFETDAGVLTAGPGDFVCIPRSVAYRYGPVSGSMRSLIIESPWPLKLSPPHPFGMINFEQDVHFAEVKPTQAPGGETQLLLKSADDEITTFVVPTDPVALMAHVGGAIPVWKLNLAKVQCATYLPAGGPPSHFLCSPDGELFLFSLSSRLTGRPPVHANADYDEIVLYVRGPGAWGGCSEPGTLTHVPKGVLHHGPEENVPEGYLAWLIETTATLRWAPEIINQSTLMETNQYSPHPSGE